MVNLEQLKAEGRYNEAIDAIQEMLFRNSEDYRLYEELADCYIYSGDFEKALNSINFGLSINPNSATWNYLKGFIYLSESKIKKSIAYLEKSNRLIPNNAEVLRNLGWAYNLEGQVERGIYILKRALNLAPKDFLIVEDLAMTLIWAWETDEGKMLLKSIWKLKENI